MPTVPKSEKRLVLMPSSSGRKFGKRQLDRADGICLAANRYRRRQLSDVARAKTRCLEAAERSAALEEAVVQFERFVAIRNDVASGGGHVEDEFVEPQALVPIRAEFRFQILFVAAQARYVLAQREVEAVLRFDRIVFFVIGVGVADKESNVTPGDWYGDATVSLMSS